MLRGDEQFYMDLIADEPLVEALFRRVTDTQEAFYRTFLDAVGDLIDVIEIEDDLGGQETSLISPMMYDRLLKPFHKELISFIKRKSPRVKVMIHCDGSIRNLLPSFIEIGIDILNPVQTNIGGMDLAGLKRDFGKDIVFQGAIDVQHVLARGTPQQVRDEVRRVIEILAPGGGYLLGSTQNMTADIPLGNVLAMFEAASTFCRY
jgi:uroporphyrinogen decarboxylase